MGEIAINKHNFELAKKRLKDFSEKKEAELAISKVRTDGGFLNLGNHKVTGSELNTRLETIQGHFISINNTNNKVIKEFREIYNALDALDKDYITSIIANVKAIEKTSNDVRTQQSTLKQHHEQLANQQNKLDAHQSEIEKTVTNISKIVAALKGFKEKLEVYKHLTDIDKIWSDCQKWHNESSSLSSSVSKSLATGKENAEKITALKHILEDANEKISQHSKSLNEQMNSINSVIASINELESISHIKDVDTMWDSLSDAHASLKSLCDELEHAKSLAVKQQLDIENLQDFVKTVSEYKHLKDVDAMWDKVNDNGKKLDNLTGQHENTVALVNENKAVISELTQYKQELSSISHIKDVDSLWDSTENHSLLIKELQDLSEESRNLIQHNKEAVDQSFAEEREKNDAIVLQLNKKINFAYWIAGTSMALALAELLILLLR